MMAPVKRQRFDLNAIAGGRDSAVLILICRDKNNEFFIPLTERFSYDGVHSGQVSLPGGKVELGESLVDAALRECSEEIGIEKENIKIRGQLTRVYIPVSNFMVLPVVGSCTITDPGFKKNPREVKSVVKLKFSELMNENIVREGVVAERNGQKIKAPYFFVEGLKVWGATAMILSEFKTLLKTIS
jgi:8-oxo-dGTP pyrophosphatase MutT (NUDIX family)